MIKVTFPDGTVICYKSATQTFVEALRKIGVDNLKDIDLEIGHLRIISPVCYEKYKTYMWPLDNGWYVNTQSDSSQKYIQLLSIKKSLNLDFDVEIGSDIKPTSGTGFTKTRQRSDSLLVKFPNDEFVGGQSPKETYIECLKKIGLETIRQKCIEAFGKECVTRFNKYGKNQIEVEKGIWITMPNQTKDKIKALEIISSKLRINLEITTI
jgi:hypothetical protein